MAAGTESGDETLDDFRRAVRSLRSRRPGEGITVEETDAPKRIAPHAFALLGEAERASGPAATGRLILLHDPQGHEAWNGTFRLVAFLSVDLDAESAADPLLADMAWSWLIGSLNAASADHSGCGGTVTCTSSVKF
ncbi:MAG: DUF3000 family protein, partial [Stackebrandtia sp.]